MVESEKMMMTNKGWRRERRRCTQSLSLSLSLKGVARNHVGLMHISFFDSLSLSGAGFFTHFRKDPRAREGV